jgi:CHRD domain
MARRRWFALLAVAIFAGLAAATYAVATPDGPRNPPNSKEFKAELNGFNETPSVSSTGWGDFRAKLVDDEKLHFEFTYHDLEGGNSLFAHVHFGSRYVAAGVSFFLCGGSTKPDPCPNVNGHVEGDVTPADVIGPNPQGIEATSFAEILRAMRAGHSYVNIHTQRWTGGEIRGQINDDDQKEFDG